jgi:uncharacterized protein YqjF (DUF2071 family)
MTGTFLHAEWRKLVMANYAVDQKLLDPYLPYKTELDLWNGICYVSLVGFMFIDTRVKGFRIPFHTNFEEVNLRFYVRYHDNGKWKRGVVFIKEIVPRWALSFVANHFYGEKYQTLPMSHSWSISDDQFTVEYKWKKSRWNSLKVITANHTSLILDNSEEEFITEHYWGYTKISNEFTSEYEVVHPKWEVFQTKDYALDVDFGDVYGPGFDFLTREKPRSVFLAEGSEIKIRHGRPI